MAFSRCQYKNRTSLSPNFKHNPLANMAPYPNAYQIEEIFATRTQPEKFHEYMAEPVDVTVVGEDHEIAGHYKSLEEFNDKIFARISDTVKRESIRLEIKRVIGGGESAVRLPLNTLKTPFVERTATWPSFIMLIAYPLLQWAAVEYSSTAQSKYGDGMYRTKKGNQNADF